MLKVKVFSVRQTVDAISYGVAILILVLFFFVLFLAALYLLEKEIPQLVMSDIEIKESKFVAKQKFVTQIMESEMALFSVLNESKVVEKIENTWKIEDEKNVYHALPESTNKTEKNAVKEIENVVVTKEYEVPQKFAVQKLQNGNIVVGRTTILNYSKLDIDLTELENPSTYAISKKRSFLIYHTHTTESYTVPGVSEVVNYRTLNPDYNVITVGNALVESLKAHGFECDHNTTMHDYPSYNGAYNASFNTVVNALNEKKYDFLLDIHRDALSSNYHFRPTVEISGEKAAKIMFVVGTNGTGLDHAHWMENLKLALLIQNRAEEMYPGLFRDLTLSSSRYNQHLSEAAFIIEVGATGNTIEEVRNSMKYLASVLASF